MDYVHSWQQEVTIFLQSDEICALTKPSSELDGTPHDNKHSLAVLLDRCLCLYFDLRVLGVRPPEVDILRQVAWIISVQPVIATHISNTQHSTCDHISSSSDNAENVSAVAPSIDNIVSMHNAAQTLKVSAIVPAIVTLRSLLDATTALHRTLRSVTITDSTSTLEQVHSSLYAHEKTMNISQCFSVVRFRSIILLLEKYHRSSSSSSASSNSASLSPSIVERLQNLVSSNDSKTWHTATSPSPSGCEQYCICRSEGTDGRAMIECSGCLEWFHYDCVHFDPFRATLPVVDVRNNVPDGSFTEDNTDIAMEKISTEEAETIEVCLDIKPILDDGFDKTTSQHDLNHKYTQNQNSRKGSRKHQVVCESDIDKIEYFCVACSEVLSGSNAYLYKWNDN